MATTTTRLGLRKPDPDPSTGDFVDAQADLNDNFDKLDAAMSFTVCTSGTRPASPFRGQGIYETDTGNVLLCTSTGPAVWTEISLDSDLSADVALGYRYVGEVRFTASGTFSKGSYSGLRAIVVEVWGGGGGSGGTSATSGSEVAQSAGGGGGGYAREQILASALATNETVTVGAGGTAGTSAPATGGTGGTTSFGSFLQATGGAGGATGTNVSSTTGGSARAGGAGGVGSGGDVNLTGQDGATSMVAGGSPLRNGVGGSAPMLGTGGATNSGINTAAVAGFNYGGGAAGTQNGTSQSARAGAAGSGGLVVVKLYK